MQKLCCWDLRAAVAETGTYGQVDTAVRQNGLVFFNARAEWNYLRFLVYSTQSLVVEAQTEELKCSR